MPCRDYSDEELRSHDLKVLNEITSYLCSTLKYLRDLEHDLKGAWYPYTNLLNANRELKAWWQYHQEMDEVRELAEKTARENLAKKQAALEKLTEEEIRILGIKR